MVARCFILVKSSHHKSQCLALTFVGICGEIVIPGAISKMAPKENAESTGQTCFQQYATLADARKAKTRLLFREPGLWFPAGDRLSFQHSSHSFALSRD